MAVAAAESPLSICRPQMLEVAARGYDDGADHPR